MRLTYFLTLATAFLTVGCATTDMERSHLRTTLASSEALADEIANWRLGLQTRVPQDVATTVSGFKMRASTMLETVQDMSDSATVGVDLAGVKQALTELSTFETSRFEDASQSGRMGLLDQFVGYAKNLERAVERLPARATS